MTATVALPHRRRRPDGVRIALTVFSTLVFVFLFLPIVFVIAHSFTDSNAWLVWDGFSTRWYGRLFDNENLKQVIRNSLKVAFFSTIIATVLGTLAGVALARRPGKWTTPFLVIVFLILVTPEIVDAIGFLIWFVEIGSVFSDGIGPFTGGEVRLWVGQSLFSSAVVTLIVRARLAGFDESLEEAAADLGATPARVFRQITLPLIFPAVLAGALLAFTFSLDNTIIASFVSISGSSTLPVYIFSSVRSVPKPDIGAAATLMFALTIFALVLVALVLRRSGESTEQVTATLTGG